MAISLFAGHPQLSLFIFYTFTAYYFYLARRGNYKFKDTLKNYFVVSILFGLMAMVQLLPLVEFLTNTQRQTLDYASAVKDSLPLKSLWTFLFSEVENSFYEPWQLWEFRCYFGIGGLALTILGVAQKKHDCRFFAAVASISLLLALGNNTPLYKWFYSFLPGLNFIRVPARFLFPFFFCTSILAAHGMNALIEICHKNSLEHSRLRKYVLTLGGFFIIAGIAAVLSFNPEHPSLKAHLIAYLILVTLIMIALTGFLRKETGSICQFFLLLIIITDLFFFSWRFLSDF